ncbi:MAG: hypothetical protein IJT21_05720 [Synergistaceae bacterium]|nr:hypothetical protein [Synergistaceae bacterium]
MHKKFFAAIIFLLVMSSLSWAETFTVTDIDSFTSAIHSVNSPSVTEANIIEFDSSVKDLTLTQEFTINAIMPVIIRGNGVNLTAANNARLFTVSSSTISFDRITFTGGSITTGDGGAVRIEQDSKVDFTNCTFYDNKAEYYGGAIAATNGTTNLYHCTIAGNIAENGGGLAVRNGTINIFASIIIGNTSGDIFKTDSGNITGSENIIGSSNYNFDATNLMDQTLSSVLATNSDGSPMIEIINGVKIINLTSTSPARDFVMNDYSVNIDETGTARPQLNYSDAGSCESLPVAIEKISIDCYPYMQINSVERVSFEILPFDSSLNILEYPPYGITWEIDNSSIISIDSQNYVHALNVGSTYLKARAHGWDSTGKKVGIMSDPILITVGTEERRERLRASIAQISDVTIYQENYRIITPLVSVDMNNTIYEDYPYTLTAHSYAENIVTVETISDDTSIILYAGDEIGSADIALTARPYPDGDATTIYFTVRVVEAQNVHVSGGGSGGCNSGFVSGVIILCAYFIKRERRNK